MTTSISSIARRNQTYILIRSRENHDIRTDILKRNRINRITKPFTFFLHDRQTNGPNIYICIHWMLINWERESSLKISDVYLEKQPIISRFPLIVSYKYTDILNYLIYVLISNFVKNNYKIYMQEILNIIIGNFHEN